MPPRRRRCRDPGAATDETTADGTSATAGRDQVLTTGPATRRATARLRPRDSAPTVGPPTRRYGADLPVVPGLPGPGAAAVRAPETVDRLADLAAPWRSRCATSRRTNGRATRRGPAPARAQRGVDGACHRSRDGPAPRVQDITIEDEDQGSATDDACTIGVDIGGTKIAAGVVSATGEILARGAPGHPRAGPGPDRRRRRRRRPRARRAAHDVVAVGVACGRLRSTAPRSTVLFAPQPGVARRAAERRARGPRRPAGRHRERRQRRRLGRVPLRRRARGRRHGAASPSAPASAAVSSSTRRLLRGAYGIGGELGHMRVVPDGIRCGCGNRGCWEVYASGNALVREARELRGVGLAARRRAVRRLRR